MVNLWISKFVGTLCTNVTTSWSWVKWTLMILCTAWLCVVAISWDLMSLLSLTLEMRETWIWLLSLDGEIMVVSIVLPELRNLAWIMMIFTSRLLFIYVKENVGGERVASRVIWELRPSLNEGRLPKCNKSCKWKQCVELLPMYLSTQMNPILCIIGIQKDTIYNGSGVEKPFLNVEGSRKVHIRAPPPQLNAR